jgi:hypothetical protein
MIWLAMGANEWMGRIIGEWLPTTTGVMPRGKRNRPHNILKKKSFLREVKFLLLCTKNS